MEDLFQNKYKIPSTRLSGWDYSSSAYYFVTICTHNRIHYFGDVLRDDSGNYSLAFSAVGKIARDGLLNIPAIYGNVRLDEWIIMPNHIHVILEIMSSVRLGGARGFVETPHDKNIVETPQWGVSTGDTDKQNPTMERKPQHHPEWKPGVLGSIVNQFKGAVTRQCREYGFDFQWQTRFYDHIIPARNATHSVAGGRNELSLYKIRRYIKNNPKMWQRDRNNLEGLLI